MPRPIPCPFCGSTRFRYGFLPEDTPDIEQDTYFVECGNRNCDVQGMAFGASRAEAIEKWNQRSGIAFRHNGGMVPLSFCPVGLFLHDGTLAVMTEYSTTTESGYRNRDAYILTSGEYFWGGTNDSDQRANLLVQPLLPITPSDRKP